MLPKFAKLDTFHVQEVLKLGYSLHSPSFQVRALKAPKTRCAVIVPKKLTRKAVERNRLRRRVYALLEHILKEREIKAHLIVFCKPQASHSTYSSLRQELKQLLSTVEKHSL